MANALKPEILGIESEFNPRKSSSKVYEDAVRDSYRKVNRTGEMSRSAIEQGDYTPYRRRVADVKSYNQFSKLDTDTSYQPKPRSWYSNEVTTPTERYTGKKYDLEGTGIGEGSTYAAPARPQIRKDDPDHLRANRPYYSRRSNLDDDDYFDYDLEHSVDMFRKPEKPFQARPGPKFWEHRLVTDSMKIEGSKPLAPHMFIKGEGDYRYDGSSYISAVLRTPSYWSHRFDHLGGT